MLLWLINVAEAAKVSEEGLILADPALEGFHERYLWVFRNLGCPDRHARLQLWRFRRHLFVLQTCQKLASSLDTRSLSLGVTDDFDLSSPSICVASTLVLG